MILLRPLCRADGWELLLLNLVKVTHTHTLVCCPVCPVCESSVTSPGCLLVFCIASLRCLHPPPAIQQHLMMLMQGCCCGLCKQALRQHKTPSQPATLLLLRRCSLVGCKAVKHIAVVTAKEPARGRPHTHSLCGTNKITTPPPVDNRSHMQPPFTA